MVKNGVYELGKHFKDSLARPIDVIAPSTTDLMREWWRNELKNRPLWGTHRELHPLPAQPEQDRATFAQRVIADGQQEAKRPTLGK